MNIGRRLASTHRALEKVLFPPGRDALDGTISTLFVGGVMRSGTNMILGVLERSDETEVYREGDPQAFDNFYLRPLPRLEYLRSRSRKRLIVFKALLDCHMVRELLSYFEPAKALWAYRHYDDVVNSDLRKWPGGRNRLEDLITDPYKTGFRARGMTEDTLQLIRSHYRPDLSDASANALFWFYRNQLFFDQELQADTRVQLVRYEDMVKAPHDVVRSLCKFLDIQHTTRMEESIHSQSINRDSPPNICEDIRIICDGMLARLDSLNDEVSE